MEKIISLCQEQGYKIGELTIGQCIEIADQLQLSVGDVVIAEAIVENDMTEEEVLEAVYAAFEHNLTAAEVGRSEGHSLLLGTIGQELSQYAPGEALIADAFIDRALIYTLSSQVGNHSCGLEPCAGTGDSCVYTGLVRAMVEHFGKEKQVLKAFAVLLKVGSIFRVGKTTTGCNMEGFGAGSAATAAAIVELNGGSPVQLERAIVLAISPTIANPCTPRVMVAGLCATHIAGAIHMGNLSAQLALKTTIPVDVPADVMIAMASTVHPLSAKYIVPTVVQFMQPFFKTKPEVEALIDDEVKRKEELRTEETMKEALEISQKLAKDANSIVKPFGEAVVGGSSQAVGSPTNAGRIAHGLSKGEIQKIKVELYPELFARRGINIPGVLMGAAFGASTADGKSYKEAVQKVREAGIEVEILEVDIPQLQRVTIDTTEGTFMVDTLNRGGARLVIRDALPSTEIANEVAKNLGIVVVS